METKPYVRIQSTTDINVTPGLQAQDVTNPELHVPDRLKVSPAWPKACCFINKGVGVYPSYIVEWNTVKALVKNNVLTIGEYLDDVNEEAKATKEKLDLGVKDMEADVGKSSHKVKDVNLSKLAGD